MMNIGDIEIPIVYDIVDTSEANDSEIKSLQIDNVEVKHNPSVENIVISGYLNPTIHSENLSIEKQKEQVNKLRKDKDKIDNSINYKDYKGYLLVEDVDLLDENNSRIIHEIQISARYFPWPKYYPNKEPI
jgi:hypothetical protein